MQMLNNTVAYGQVKELAKKDLSEQSDLFSFVVEVQNSRLIGNEKTNSRVAMPCRYFAKKGNVAAADMCLGCCVQFFARYDVDDDGANFFRVDKLWVVKGGRYERARNAAAVVAGGGQ